MTATTGKTNQEVHEKFREVMEKVFKGTPIMQAFNQGKFYPVKHGMKQVADVTPEQFMEWSRQIYGIISWMETYCYTGPAGRYWAASDEVKEGLKDVLRGLSKAAVAGCLVTQIEDYSLEGTEPESKFPDHIMSAFEL